jgi:hypothetical protein
LLGSVNLDNALGGLPMLLRASVHTIKTGGAGMDATSGPVSGARVISSVLHKINPATGSATVIEVNATVPDLEDYLDKLLSEIGEQSQKRSYKFASPATEFRTCLNAFYADQALHSNLHADLLANRLVKQEAAAIQRYKNLNEVTRGSFLQFMFEEDSKLFYLGVKVEHQSFLDEQDFQRKFGLAEHRRLYKACRVSFADDGDPSDVWVFDTNGTPAAYWWREFLELEVSRDDAENTKIAAEAVMQTIGAIKTRFPADHTILRNATVAAFKQQAEMNYTAFVENVFGAYEPIDASAAPHIDRLVDRLKELPDKKKFDTQFALVPAAVPYRKTKVVLSPEITLTIEEGIKNLADKIWSEITPDGRELVVIESDKAKLFPRKAR